MTKRTRIILTLIIVLAILIAATIILVSVFSNKADNKNNSKYDIQISFLAVSDGDLRVFYYYITDEHQVYELMTDYPDPDWESNDKFISADAPKMNLDEDAKKELEAIISGLDHDCATHITAIIEDIPEIFIKYSNGDEGGYYYGEPDNNAFNDIVAFLVDNSSHSIEWTNGSDFKPRYFASSEKSDEAYNKIINQADFLVETDG